MTTARNTNAEIAMARGNVYGLLAKVFRAEPSIALIDEMKSSVFTETLAAMGFSLGTEFARISSERLAGDLAIEFTQLFIGPGPHISPHESIFSAHADADSGLWGEQTVAVKKFIETAGFEYQTGFSGLPDHISTELEFMQKLAEAEAQLWEKAETERAEWLLRVQVKFINEHLERWVPKLCDAIIEKAQMPFYARMADLMKSVIEFEAASNSEDLSACA